MFKLIRKIIFLPISWAIRLLIGLSAFVVSLSSSLLNIVVSLFVLLAAVMLMIGEFDDAYALLILAVVISPIGLPFLANRLLDGLDFLLTKVTDAICL